MFVIVPSGLKEEHFSVLLTEGPCVVGILTKIVLRRASLHISHETIG